MAADELEDYEDTYETADDLIDKIRAKALHAALERIESGKASDGLLQIFLKGILPESLIDQEVKTRSLNLMDAKVEKLKSEVTSEQQFQDAIKAFARYSGHTDEAVEIEEFEE